MKVKNSGMQTAHQKHCFGDSQTASLKCANLKDFLMGNA